jgi:hypothetical protein
MVIRWPLSTLWKWQQCFTSCYFLFKKQNLVGCSQCHSTSNSNCQYLQKLTLQDWVSSSIHSHHKACSQESSQRIPNSANLLWTLEPTGRAL